MPDAARRRPPHGRTSEVRGTSPELRQLVKHCRVAAGRADCGGHTSAVTCREIRTRLRGWGTGNPEANCTAELGDAWTEFFWPLPDRARLVVVAAGNGAVALVAVETAADLGQTWEPPGARRSGRRQAPGRHPFPPRGGRRRNGQRQRRQSDKHARPQECR